MVGSGRNVAACANCLALQVEVSVQEFSGGYRVPQPERSNSPSINRVVGSGTRTRRVKDCRILGVHTRDASGSLRINPAPTPLSWARLVSTFEARATRLQRVAAYRAKPWTGQIKCDR